MHFFSFFAITTSLGIFDNLPTELTDVIMKFLPVKDQLDMTRTCKSFRRKINEMYREPVLMMIENLKLDRVKIEIDKKLFKEMETFTKIYFSKVQDIYYLKHKYICDNKYSFIEKNRDIQDFIGKTASFFIDANESFKDVNLPRLTIILFKSIEAEIGGNSGRYLMKSLLKKTLRKPDKHGQVLKYLVNVFYGIKRGRLISILRLEFGFSIRECEELINYQYISELNNISVLSAQCFLFLTVKIVVFKIISKYFKFNPKDFEIFSSVKFVVLMIILGSIQFKYVLIQRFNQFYELND